MNEQLKFLAKKILGERMYQQTVIWRHRSAIPFKYGIRSSLKNTGIYHMTDKYDENHTFAGVSYLDVYEKYFAAFKNESIALFEIGVRDGASLRTWKSYFPKAEIFGIDIDPRCKAFEEDRIHIEIGSQDDGAFLEKCFGAGQKFDIILDDGSHINRMTLTAFQNLFNQRLKHGGIYIIEDLGCSYDQLQTNHNILETWPGMKYNDPDQSFDNNRKDMDSFFLEKIEEMDHRTGNILAMHFWPMICVILKSPALPQK